jgi:uncharacterized protein
MWFIYKICLSFWLVMTVLTFDGHSIFHNFGIFTSLYFISSRFTHDTHQYFTKPSPVEVGDYIEFLAEIDLLVSASTCPQGDVSIACGDKDHGVPTVYPLLVEIYELTDQEYLTHQGWKPSPINGYSGNHGL